LGLLLLFAGQPACFETCSLPDWIAVWLAKRAEQESQRATHGSEHGAAAGQAEKERRSTARAAGRDQKIRAGLDDLETWLRDLLRQGLASAQNQPRAFWETPTARLVDAQAPGLARLVRAMPSLAASGAGWQEHLLEQISRLYLAIEGYRHIDSQTEGTQADLRSLVGINLRQEDLLQGPGTADTWLVLGREIEEETKLKVQRTWLWGKECKRHALVLSFSAAGAKLDTSLIPGMAFPGELVYYPSAFPLRAIVRSRGDALDLPAEMPGCDGLAEATRGYAVALSHNPWIEHFPVILNCATPFFNAEDWFLADPEGRRVPLAKQFPHVWTLLSLSGGQPLGIFGEWNGERLLPLSAWVKKQFFAFRPNLE
jgi:hypothetical protein